MTAFGLGPMPGSDFASACDIVMGETGQLPHLPQLPGRGLGSDAVGRTASLLSAVSVERGPRSWRLSDRPQLVAHEMWDQMSRDLDTAQEVWGETLPQIKVQMLGPWSLATALELGDGHRAITDSGAFRDLTDALLDGLDSHKQDVAKRFHCGTDNVLVQIDEPYLAHVLAGAVPGTTDFDVIPAVPVEVALDTLRRFEADFLNAGIFAQVWEFSGAARTLLRDLASLRSSADLDGLGQHCDKGGRVGFGVPAGDAVRTAKEIVAAWERIGLDLGVAGASVDVYPLLNPAGSSLDIAAAYRHAAAVADNLTRG